MAAPFNDTLSKSEAALAASVTALALTGTRGTDAANVTVNTGLDDDNAPLPRVTCQAKSSDEVILDTGNERVDVEVHIHSHSGDETLATHRARVATISDAFRADDIADVLTSAAADFHCFQVQWQGLQAEVDGNAFHSIARLTMIACSADL